VLDYGSWVGDPVTATTIIDLANKPPRAAASSRRRSRTSSVARHPTSSTQRLSSSPSWLTELDPGSERIVTYLRDLRRPGQRRLLLLPRGRRPALPRKLVAREGPTTATPAAHGIRAEQEEQASAEWNQIDWYVSFAYTGGRNWSRRPAVQLRRRRRWRVVLQRRPCATLPEGARVNGCILPGTGYVAVGEDTGCRPSEVGGRHCEFKVGARGCSSPSRTPRRYL
jgi:hypothetical protein